MEKRCVIDSFEFNYIAWHQYFMRFCLIEWRVTQIITNWLEHSPVISFIFIYISFLGCQPLPTKSFCNDDFSHVLTLCVGGRDYCLCMFLNKITNSVDDLSGVSATSLKQKLRPFCILGDLPPLGTYKHKHDSDIV